MSKVNMSFKTRIKLVLYILFSKKYYEGFILEQCHLCKGTEICVTNKKIEQNIYTAKYYCKTCGATATVEENWSMKGKV